ncbi:MAG: sulfatase-like hydrolase/transferase [Bacteroidetes bacterium]|nr:sulfatase-like hydrolase/transferase [Bacteroidota bacterium]
MIVNPDSAFRPYNVVLIIMESFSFEHISYYNPGKSTTPFFDSLLRNTISFPNTFANAKRSIEGIPAVITSLPALMDQPFINSAYNVNKINSLASLLKPLGYRSGFFHGGKQWHHGV